MPGWRLRLRHTLLGDAERLQATGSRASSEHLLARWPAESCSSRVGCTPADRHPVCRRPLQPVGCKSDRLAPPYHCAHHAQRGEKQRADCGFRQQRGTSREIAGTGPAPVRYGCSTLGSKSRAGFHSAAALVAVKVQPLG